jgi:hypothetical protein
MARDDSPPRTTPEQSLKRYGDPEVPRSTRGARGRRRGVRSGQAIGLEVPEASRDYIHLYRGDSDALTASLERIQRTTSSIRQSIRVGEKAARKAAQRDRYDVDR